MRKKFAILKLSLCFICYVTLSSCSMVGNTIVKDIAEIPTSSGQTTQLVTSSEKINDTLVTSSNTPDISSQSSSIPTLNTPESSTISSSAPVSPSTLEQGAGEKMLQNVINIEIGDNKFTITLDDNPSAERFKSMLPMTIEMGDLNGNEKYHYLSESLPTDSRNFGSVKNGDIMLYGSDCLVLFYEGFTTSYRYTRLGVVDNPSRLKEILGSGSVMVKWK